MDLLSSFLESHRQAKEVDEHMVFMILKSNNKNVVVYSENRTDAGNGKDADNGNVKDTEHCERDANRKTVLSPIRAYWQTWDERKEDTVSPPTHELSTLERRFAYGIKYISNLENDVQQFTLNAYPKMPITLTRTSPTDPAVPTITFHDMVYNLIGIYVHLPTVSSSVSFDTIRPKGVSLAVQVYVKPDELSPPFMLYIDSKADIE
jgi:hypothetical protein